MTKRTRYHVGVDIRGALQWTDKQLTHFLVDADTGRPLTPHEAREWLVEELRSGKDGLTPACDNQDNRGWCKGHPVDPPSKDRPAREGLVRDEAQAKASGAARVGGADAPARQDGDGGDRQPRTRPAQCRRDH